MDERVREWRKAGRYLPKRFRDFHDQKALFKTVHETMDFAGHEYAKDVSWIAGHCYVIDMFLWFMARHGYVLRRSDVKLPFDDLEITISDNEARARDRMLCAMGLTPVSGPHVSD